MKLYEFEGHRILAKAGIESPFFVVCENLEETEQALLKIDFPIVCKVQVLLGKRGKSGGVKVAENKLEALNFCKKNFGREFLGEKVRYISLTKKVAIKSESYISITYDTAGKTPILIYSNDGGVDIEDVKLKDPEALFQININPIMGPKISDLKRIFAANSENLVDFSLRLWDAFSKNDCRLVEVNPLAYLTGGGLVAIDAKVILDDSALGRHRDIDVLYKGAVSAIPTERELAARKIDEEDYRGSAGSTFIEFDGDIAILASGGGASLLVMDSLFAAGGKPANYTEYSGNPPKDKVEKLTRITLGRKGLSGCLVAGAVANFTDIYETLSGFAKGLKAVKPKVNYPIVIRRGGPRQKEAYDMLLELAKKEGFDIHLIDSDVPISVASKIIAELSSKYKNRKL